MTARERDELPNFKKSSPPSTKDGGRGGGLGSIAPLARRGALPWPAYRRCEGGGGGGPSHLLSSHLATETWWRRRGGRTRVQERKKETAQQPISAQGKKGERKGRKEGMESIGHSKEEREEEEEKRRDRVRTKE